MAMQTRINVDLYKIGNTATVIGDGFALENRNDASFEVVDGEVVATKLGVHRIGPATVEDTRDRARNHGKDFFDEIHEDVTMRVYRSGRAQHFVPAGFDVMVGLDGTALYDTEDGIVYEPRLDDMNNDVNLVGVETNTVRKETHDDIQSQIGSRYVPLACVQSN